MKRKPVESATIKSIGYDPENGLLQIEFNTGSVYDYYDVAEKVHADFLAAKSKGRFFYNNIKGEFHYGKVDGGQNASSKGSGPGDLR